MTASTADREEARTSQAEDLLVAGFSTRAAAQSARWAGFRVAACDAFLDRDLQAACDESYLLSDLRELPTVAERISPRRWLYAGGIENDPPTVAAVSRRHRLLGCGANVLRQVRDPFALQRVAVERGLRFPRMLAIDEARTSTLAGRFLRKSFCSGGGRGIVELRDAASQPTRGSSNVAYLQAFISGTSLGASFLAADGGCRLLGVCRQLSPAPTDHHPFRYLGSVGPIRPAATVTNELLRWGELLTREFGVRGLFGIDVVVDERERTWLLEVNPRYTASMELLERAGSESIIGLHVAALERGVLPQAVAMHDAAVHVKRIVYYDGPTPALVSAAFSDRLFAEAQSAAIPGCGDRPTARYSSTADVPRAGTLVSPGDPLCTVFGVGGEAERSTVDSAAELLRRFRETSCGS